MSVPAKLLAFAALLAATFGIAVAAGAAFGPEEAAKPAGHGDMAGRPAGDGHGAGDEARDVGDQLLYKLVAEDGLANADEQGATNSLDEDEDRRAGRYVFDVEHGLHSHQWLLHAHTNTRAEEDLVPNPNACCRVRLPCR